MYGYIFGEKSIVTNFYVSDYAPKRYIPGIPFFGFRPMKLVSVYIIRSFDLRTPVGESLQATGANSLYSLDSYTINITVV